jgi:muramidase (phage lysozyme)
MSKERQILEQWARQNPGLFEGLKQSISGAEGTILGGKPGYNVMFGGGRFQGYERHPNRVISSPGGYSSAAAGAYQFMPGTWSGVQKSLGLPDFSPKSQDIGMLKKVRERLMPLGGLSAISKAGTLTPQIQAALAPEWASFPTETGKSYYGQPVKSVSQIQNFFEEGKKRGQNLPPTLAAVESAPSATAQQVQRGDSLGRGLLQQVMGVLPFMQRRQSALPTAMDLISLDPNPLGMPSPQQQFLSMFMEDII